MAGGLRDTEATFEVHVNGINKLTELEKAGDRAVSSLKKLDEIIVRGFNGSSASATQANRINEVLEKSVNQARKLDEVLKKTSVSGNKSAESAAKTAFELQKQLEVASKISTSSARIADARAKEMVSNDKVALSAEKIVQAQTRSAEMSVKLSTAQLRSQEAAVKAANAQEKETVAIAKSVAQAEKLSSAREKDLALAEKYSAQTAALNNSTSASRDATNHGTKNEGKISSAIKEGISLFAPGMLVASGVMKSAEYVKELFKQGAEYNSEQSGMSATWKTLVDGARGEGVSEKEAGSSKDLTKSITMMSRDNGRTLELVNEGYQQMYHATESAERTKHLVQSELRIGDAMGLSDAQAERFSTYGVGHALDKGKVNGGSLNQMVQYAPAISAALTRAMVADRKKIELADVSEHDVEKEKSNLRSEVSKGHISAKMLEEAINYLGDTKFKDTAENAMSSIPGMVRSFKTGLPRMVGDFENGFLTPLGKATSSFFGSATKWINSDQSDKWATNIGENLSKVTSKFTEFSFKIGVNAVEFWNKARPFRDGFADGFVSEFNKIKTSVKVTIGVAKEFGDTVRNIIPKGTGNNISGVTTDIGNFTGKVSAFVFSLKGLSHLPIIGKSFDGMLGKIGSVVGKLPVVGGVLERIIGGHKQNSTATNMLRASETMMSAANKMSAINGVGIKTGSLASDASLAKFTTRTQLREAEEAVAYAATRGGKFATMAAKGNATLGLTPAVNEKGEVITRGGVTTRLSSNAGFIARQTAKVQKYVGETGERIVTSGIGKGLATMSSGLKSTGKFLGKGMPGMNSLFAGIDAVSVMTSTKSGTKERDAGLANAVGNGVGATIGAALGTLIPGLGQTGIGQMLGGVAGGYVGGKVGSWFGTAIHKDDNTNQANKVTPTQALAQAQELQAKEDFVNQLQSSKDNGGFGLDAKQAKKDYQLLGQAQKSNSVSAQKYALDYQRAFENGDTKAINIARDNIQKWSASVQDAANKAKQAHEETNKVVTNPDSDSPLSLAIKKQNKGVGTGPIQFKNPKKSTTLLRTTINDESSSPLAITLNNSKPKKSTKRLLGPQQIKTNDIGPRFGSSTNSPLATALAFSKVEKTKNKSYGPYPKKLSSKKTSSLDNGSSSTPLISALSKPQSLSNKSYGPQQSKKISEASKKISKTSTTISFKSDQSRIGSSKKTTSSILKDNAKPVSSAKRSRNVGPSLDKKASTSSKKSIKSVISSFKKSDSSRLSSSKKADNLTAQSAKKTSIQIKKAAESAAKGRKKAAESAAKSSISEQRKTASSTLKTLKRQGSDLEKALKKQSGGQKTQLNRMKSQQKTALSSMNRDAQKSFKNFSKKATAAIKKANKAMKSGMRNMSSTAKSAKTSIESQFKKLTTTIKSSLNKAKSTTKNGIKSIASSIKSGFKNIGIAGKSEFNKLSSSVKSGMSKSASVAKSGSVKIVSAVKSGISKMGSGGATGMNSLSTNIKNGMNKAIISAKSGATNVVSAAKIGLNKIGTAGTSGFNKLCSSITSSMSKGATATASGMNKIATVITSGMNKTVSVVISLGNKINSVLTTAFNKASTNAGSASSKISGSMSSIGSSANSATSKIHTLAAAINSLKSKTITITANIEGKGASKLESGTFNAMQAFSAIVPKYAQGTSGGHKGGVALVNDAKESTFREAFLTPNGSLGVFPAIRNLLLDLPKGTHVLNARDTKRMFGSQLPIYERGTSSALQAVEQHQNAQLTNKQVSKNKTSINQKNTAGVNVTINLNIENAGTNAVNDITSNLEPRIRQLFEDMFRGFNNRTQEIEA